MNTNYSILQQNILGSLDTEDAKALFLECCHQPEDDGKHYWAEEKARAFDQVAKICRHAFGIDGRLDNERTDDLIDFVRGRYWHRYVKSSA